VEAEEKAREVAEKSERKKKKEAQRAK